MSNEEQNVATIRALYEAYARKDPSVLFGSMAEDGQIGFVGNKQEFKFGGMFRTVPSACGRPVELEGACVYAVPYLEPDVARVLRRSGRTGPAEAVRAVARDRRGVARQRSAAQA